MKIITKNFRWLPDNNLINFTDLHKRMEDEMKSNKRTIDPIVTLRNLKYICNFCKNNISPRIAAEISFTARFPLNERKDIEELLNKFVIFQDEKEKEKEENLKKEIEKEFKKYNIVYDNNRIKPAYLAITACRQGHHTLLIGKKGSGLTTFAKFIANICNKENKFLLCTSETSVEDIIGCFQPGRYDKQEEEKEEKVKRRKRRKRRRK